MTNSKILSHLFTLGGIWLNENDWIKELREKRIAYGLSQNKLAVEAGISREHLNRLESGKVALTEEIKMQLLVALERYNPEAQLTMLFDYVRIRFPTTDVKHVIEDILKFIKCQAIMYKKYDIRMYN